MKCACDDLIAETKKSKKGRSKHTFEMIKECSAIENPNILEKHNLCEWKRVFTSVPFSLDPNPIYEKCKNCENNLDAETIFEAIHSGEYGEIIWGRVVKN